ncbi:dTDP-4-dehydrorhamnose reductase [Nitrosomonas sp.]|uniref:dTDP-4-dehydrorhamnose reductase n=1 Tax=Nitrosomonas sp. TaxID=42353 RepID=UPI00283E86F8|nr:dTDP-4-dehydrorhamnose reductase [Nitrosomonas sp.]MCP5243188.1 dTDP-4-dehydrorhamnose reductase [Burkholderiales bacterium]MDR4513969.1 dTDP-4-dehydrorhamnose reductase [Nitrosomonas sp.]
MKILLFGKNGQVGWELQRSLAPLTASDRLFIVGSDSPTLCGSLANPEGIRQTIQTVKPDIIINAAAYTAVDKAEQEPKLAQTINAEAPAVMADEARRLNAWLIHYSTDYVFDGSGDQPRTETDSTGPLNVYGRTKLSGENNIIESGCAHVILRTSWVYATYGSNFVKTILRLACERDLLKIVDDQLGAPTGAELIADVTAHIIRALRQQKNETAVSGLYHLTAQGCVSWYGFARFILEQAAETGMPLNILPENVHPIFTTDYPTPAKRPLNSRLNITKIQKTFDVCLPEWQIGVSRVLAEMLTDPITVKC